MARLEIFKLSESLPEQDYLPNNLDCPLGSYACGESLLARTTLEF